MEKIIPRNWENLMGLTSAPKSYKCGYCSNKVGSEIGWSHVKDRRVQSISYCYIYVCPICGNPTYFDYTGKQIPGAKERRDIEKLPSDIKEVYDEMRVCTQNNCFTATVLLGRKLIMHLAVNVCSAKEGLNFWQYVDALNSSKYIPPKSQGYVTKIKDLGNKHNHQLKIAKKEDADFILEFTELLLSFMFEYTDENLVREKTEKSTNQETATGA